MEYDLLNYAIFIIDFKRNEKKRRMIIADTVLISI